MALFKREPKVGIALGGGGVRGFAHLAILDVLDSLNIRPHAIAGTSMGAIIGSLYAAGMSSQKIREELMLYTVTSDDTVKTVLQKRKNLVKWLEAFRVAPGSGGVVRPDGLLEFLFGMVQKTRFDELEIPLTVITADYWNGEEVRFSEGDLIAPVQASMSVPGVFSPVEINNRILVDGGIVNQVPYDVLTDSCDIVIAVDVGGIRVPEDGRLFPKPMNAALVAFEIAQETMLREKMQWNRPTIYVRPELKNVGLLEFDKFEDVLELGDRMAGKFRAELKEVLSEYDGILKPLSDLIPMYR